MVVYENCEEEVRVRHVDEFIQVLEAVLLVNRNKYSKFLDRDAKICLRYIDFMNREVIVGQE